MTQSWPGNDRPDTLDFDGLPAPRGDIELPIDQRLRLIQEILEWTPPLFMVPHVKGFGDSLTQPGDWMR